MRYGPTARVVYQLDCYLRECVFPTTLERQYQKLTEAGTESIAFSLRKEFEAGPELRAEIGRLSSALDYVIDNTYCGVDAEWHFKPGYDPQIVLDALGAKSVRSREKG